MEWGRIGFDDNEGLEIILYWRSCCFDWFYLSSCTVLLLCLMMFWIRFRQCWIGFENLFSVLELRRHESTDQNVSLYSTSLSTLSFSLFFVVQTEAKLNQKHS
jgi:hypothetical protein